MNQPITSVGGLAAHAEKLGFDELWLADHYYNRDTSVALALMAQHTETATLGTAVASPFLRHPTLLASLAATITELAGQRFVLGLGSGGYEFPQEMDIAIKRPLAAIAESTRVVRELLAGPADVTGEVFSARGAALRWPAAPTPVYLAARGPKMLALAGDIADGVITHGISDRHIAYVQEKTGGGAQVCLMLDVDVDDDQAAAYARLRPRCLMMAGGSYADELIDVYGLPRDEVRQLRSTLRLEGRDQAAALVTDDMAAAFGIAGPAAHVREELDRLAARGVDSVILSVGGTDPDGIAGAMTRLAEAVIA
ncbi:LLM class flavin-dependent oxidoreductase [Phytoactinopolyspora limicola]|uniref:LLM class flavin-dependent oxidoreductase n=1 Tax=Phytoactinopolyspora limicola TaxID=2715536 RepID=UPI00140AE22C|nr:LLM class flavin-dependent oxidoreductase [Phytoactinopolyspora limicola]